MTYKEAYDKIIQAYFRDEIKPMNPKFCFCGTLAGGQNWGDFCRPHNASTRYTYDEFINMEAALLDTIDSIMGIPNKAKQELPIYEVAMFEGMCAALEVLKQIHLSRGENVDDVEGVGEFKKRELVNH